MLILKRVILKYSSIKPFRTIHNYKKDHKKDSNFHSKIFFICSFDTKVVPCLITLYKIKRPAREVSENSRSAIALEFFWKNTDEKLNVLYISSCSILKPNSFTVFENYFKHRLGRQAAKQLFSYYYSFQKKWLLQISLDAPFSWYLDNCP